MSTSSIENDGLRLYVAPSRGGLGYIPPTTSKSVPRLSVCQDAKKKFNGNVDG